jgi:CheY-like chemotaxis protein
MTPHPILVVDEDPELLAAYKELLAVAGYQVLDVPSAREALAILDRARPELLLTDISMPEMDGFELIEQMQAKLEDEAPPVLVCSAFRITEREAINRGARRFLAKPVKPTTLLAVVEELLGGAPPPQGELEAERRWVTEERTRSRAASHSQLAEVARVPAAGFASPWLEWLRTYFACSWGAVYLLDGDELEVLAAAGQPAIDLLEGQALRANVAEVVETGTALTIADVQEHPAFHLESDGGPRVRLLIAIPLQSRADVAVGALCLADSTARRCDAESLVILEQLGRHGELLATRAAGTRPAPVDRRAPLLAQATFESLLEMELRIARRCGEVLELAVIDLGEEVSSLEGAQLLWAVSAGARVAIGSFGPRRVGFYQRGPAEQVQQHIGAGIEAVRKRGMVDAAGVVSVSGTAGLSEAAVVRLGELALLEARTEASDSPKRIVVGPPR